MTIEALLEWVRRKTGKAQVWPRLPGLVGRVHLRDTMFGGDSEESIAAYSRTGSSAIENIEEALQLAGSSFGEIRSCLDFGCGYGRVLRWLRQHIRGRRITACDVDEDAVRFCSREFGAIGLVSSPEIDKVRLGTYDLIWTGSVVTHVEDDTCDEILAALGRSLASGGVLVFSTHGEFCYANLEHLYGGLFAAQAQDILREVSEFGVAYRPYEQEYGGYRPGAYGVSWHSREYMTAKMSRICGQLRLLGFKPQGWDSHHDVYTYQRAAS